MNKIAIITLTKNANHGNVLQNIAMQDALKSIGIESETIINKTNSSLFAPIKNNYKNALKYLINYHNFRTELKRNKLFQDFCQNNVIYSGIIYENGQFSSKGLDEYDYFITGSDQVWNPTFGFASQYEFLTFIPSNKRISYAASFGVSNLEMISIERRREIGEMLSAFSYVSVREESGKEIVESISDIKAEVHIDPTMLINGNQWREKARKTNTNIPSKFVLVYLLGELTREYRKTIKGLANKYNARVVNVLDKKCRYIDPLEFIWLIDNAIYVCTDSFHATVFSILFHKQFYIFDRKDQHADQGNRFSSLLKVCGISDKLVSACNGLLEYSISWEHVDERLNAERRKSFDYLQSCIFRKKEQPRYVEVIDKKDCCGCSGCAQICPKNAISMKQDRGGFLFPLVNRNLCVNCGLCKAVCPVVNAVDKGENVISAYAGYAKDESIRLKSSSGGLFSEIAMKVLNENGVIYGAAFDEKQRVHHIGIDTSDKLNLLRGSKYVQSDIERTYSEAENKLKEGKLVLYTGTACQIAGLKRLLNKHYDNLLTVDVLCHGVPAPRLWDRYKKNQEDRYGAVIQHAFFRQKYFGWKMFAVELQFCNSKAYIKKFVEDPFMKLFLGNICLRDSCYACRFKSLERDSDITIGDAWGIENKMPDLDDDKGTSVILVHTEMGRNLLHDLSDRIIVCEGNVDGLLPSNSDSRKSVLKHQNREKIFEMLDDGKSCEEMLVLLNSNINALQRVKRKIKRLLLEK